MTDPIRDSNETPEPPAAPAPKAGDESLISRIPLALLELNDLVERDNAAHRPHELSEPSESLADAKPAARSGGGRSARMLVEDAADDRARDRLKNWGRGESASESTPPRDPEPIAEPVPETMTAPPARRRGPGRTIALFFVLATIATALMMTSERWLPLVTNEAPTPVASAPAPQVKPAPPVAAPTAPAPAPVLTPVPTAPPQTVQPAAGADSALSNQALAALMARVATLEAALGNTASLTEVNRRVESLEGKSVDASSVLALADRVTAIERGAQSAADVRAAAVALTIAATQWREAVVMGRPFLKEWDTVKALTGNTATDAIFAKYASTGLPTLADLQRRFDAAAAAATRASYLPNETAGWVRRVLDRVFSVVTIRRTDVDTGDDIEAVLVRAERAVDANNLPGAIAEMKKLTGASLAAAGDWIALAEARTAAEETAQQSVIAGTTALGAPPSAPAAPPPPAE